MDVSDNCSTRREQKRVSKSSNSFRRLDLPPLTLRRGMRRGDGVRGGGEQHPHPQPCSSPSASTVYRAHQTDEKQRNRRLTRYGPLHRQQVRLLLKHPPRLLQYEQRLVFLEASFPKEVMAEVFGVGFPPTILVRHEQLVVPRLVPCGFGDLCVPKASSEQDRGVK